MYDISESVWYAIVCYCNNLLLWISSLGGLYNLGSAVGWLLGMLGRAFFNSSRYEAALFFLLPLIIWRTNLKES